jgi:hypothetical protein
VIVKERLSGLIVACALAIGGTSLAQEPTAPTLGAVLRENEQLKREIAVLRVTLRERDARLQLAAFEREGMVKAVSQDPSDPDGTKAVKARCAALEPQLRAIEQPGDRTTFDCATLAFTRRE